MEENVSLIHLETKVALFYSKSFQAYLQKEYM